MSDELPEYGVMYIVKGHKAGSNPFGHSAIALVCKNGDKMEIKKMVGDYPMPKKGKGFSGKVKIALGLDIYFSGNHGIFIDEPFRKYDTGLPMYGQLYPLTQENYDKLYQRCQTRMTEERQAIKQHAKALNLRAKPRQQTRHYRYEDDSLRIYEAEKQLPNPRLKSFDLTVTNKAKNCMVEALNLLRDFISPEEIKRLEGWHKTFPVLGGKLPRVCFHSEGPLIPFKKRPDEVVYFRRKGKSRLWLTTCTYNPNVIEVVERLQQLEWLMINAKMDKTLSPKRDALVADIRKHYECFSKDSPIKSQADTGWSNSLMCLFTPKEDPRIRKARVLFGNLHAAVIGEFERINDLSFLVAPALELADKKKLCDIIGKPYVDVSLERRCYG